MSDADVRGVPREYLRDLLRLARGARPEALHAARSLGPRLGAPLPLSEEEEITPGQLVRHLGAESAMKGLAIAIVVLLVVLRIGRSSPLPYVVLTSRAPPDRLAPPKPSAGASRMKSLAYPARRALLRGVRIALDLEYHHRRCLRFEPPGCTANSQCCPGLTCSPVDGLCLGAPGASGGTSSGGRTGSSTSSSSTTTSTATGSSGTDGSTSSTSGMPTTGSSGSTSTASTSSTGSTTGCTDACTVGASSVSRRAQSRPVR